MRILANDGIDPTGKRLLEEQGHIVITQTVTQSELGSFINQESIECLLVRSATTVRKDLIDSCPGLRLVGRGGVGIDNIDVDYANEKGLTVFNTPASSSQSVAELVIAMMYSSARYLYSAGGTMPIQGQENFAQLKKNFSKGTELRGKTLAIVGMGRIGQSLAITALGLGMKVIGVDRSGNDHCALTMSIFGCEPLEVLVPLVKLEMALVEADYVSLHVPKQPNGAAVISKHELKLMKPTGVVINTSRGGVVDETALLDALNEGEIGGACLDVFIGEPKPNSQVLSHSKVICTPHIGASTSEAQTRIGEEIAKFIFDYCSK